MQRITATEPANWIDDAAHPDSVPPGVREPREFATCRIDGAVPMPTH